MKTFIRNFNKEFSKKETIFVYCLSGFLIIMIMAPIFEGRLFPPWLFLVDFRITMSMGVGPWVAYLTYWLIRNTFFSNKKDHLRTKKDLRTVRNFFFILLIFWAILLVFMWAVPWEPAVPPAQVCDPCQ